MKVLWLVNIMLPAFAKAEGLPFSEREGWLTGCYERMNEARRAGYRRAPELTVCFPAPAGMGNFRKEIDGNVFYGFRENMDTPEKYDSALEARFREILEEAKPDIVHIFGTEYPHALAMAKAFGRPERTLIGLQGLCYVIAERCLDGIPGSVIRRETFRDRVRRDSLLQQREKFRLRGENEKQALLLAGHVTGRTGFDRKAAAAVNGAAVYHFMNETLRPTFYGPVRERKNIEPHSIFLSQGDYPLKGFHTVLEAMPYILAEYPDAKVYVSGISVIGDVGGMPGAKKKYPRPLWITSYGKYLLQLIQEYYLQENVIMLGTLSAQEMADRMLRSEVFVCPSSLENSPNSLGEAMLLGVPCAASLTGGIPDIMEDGKEGLFFAPGSAERLADCVKQLFADPAAADALGAAARKRALRDHDADRNYRRLLDVYEEIL